MGDSLSHLRKMKRRVTHSTKVPVDEDVSAVEKVLELEKILEVFRAEVDMKLTIMEQILSTRNEQMSVQKKVLDREQILYDTLLGHWKNTPKLAKNGLTVNFGEASFGDFEDNEENQDPEYDDVEDEEYYPGVPSRKKSKSSLRKQRKSAKTTQKKNTNAIPNPAEKPDVVDVDTTGSSIVVPIPDEESAFPPADDSETQNTNEWFGKAPVQPVGPAYVKMETGDDAHTLKVEDEDDTEDVELELEGFETITKRTTSAPRQPRPRPNHGQKRKRVVEITTPMTMHFTYVDEEEKYVCNHCSAPVSKRKDGSNYNMKRHIVRCHPDIV